MGRRRRRCPAGRAPPGSRMPFIEAPDFRQNSNDSYWLATRRWTPTAGHSRHRGRRSRHPEHAHRESVSCRRRRGSPVPTGLTGNRSRSRTSSRSRFRKPQPPSCRIGLSLVDPLAPIRIGTTYYLLASLPISRWRMCRHHLVETSSAIPGRSALEAVGEGKMPAPTPGAHKKREEPYCSMRRCVPPRAAAMAARCGGAAAEDPHVHVARGVTCVQTRRKLPPQLGIVHSRSWPPRQVGLQSKCSQYRSKRR